MSKATSHLITLGGGGFSMEPAGNALDRYVLRVAGKRRPKICFIGTASGDSTVYADRFLAAFKDVAVPSVLPLFNRIADPAGHLLAQDIIYVGGGNTANLLAIWRLHGIDVGLKRAFRKGTVMAGISAGMNCWHSACSTDSFGPLAPLGDGLGWVQEAACPHFDGEAERRPTLLKWVASGKLPTTHAADDFAAFHYVRKGNDIELLKCVKSRLSSGCYRAVREGRRAVLEALPTELID
jgi:peptidase E